MKSEQPPQIRPRYGHDPNLLDSLISTVNELSRQLDFSRFFERAASRAAAAMAADRAASSILDGPEYLLYRFFIGLPTEYKHRFGVLVLDLNGFKQVNDRMGHQVGDRLLRDIAQRLRDVVRRAGLVARPGGDEFVLLLENISRIDDIENIVRRVLTATSIGITTFPFDDAAPETLLSHADAAVYKV